MENNRPLGWTTLEEAKKLVEAGLDPNTADMSYELDTQSPKAVSFVKMEKYYKALYVTPLYNPMTKAYPCWSLGALIELMRGISFRDAVCSPVLKRGLLYGKWCIDYGHDFYRTEYCFDAITAVMCTVEWLVYNGYIKKSE